MMLTLLLMIANIMGAGMILPQLVRLTRSRDSSGLSGVWMGVGIAMNSWWVGYAIATRIWGILPVSMVAAAFYLTMAAMFVTIAGGAAWRALLSGFGALALVPLPFLLVSGWPATGAVIGLCYGGQFVPAALSAVRSASVTGISTLTWTMAWIEAVIWLFYGLTVGDAALIIGGGGGSVMAALIVIRVVATSRRERAGRALDRSTHGEPTVPVGVLTVPVGVES